MTVRLLILNAPLVFCHGVDNEVRSIPMSRRTMMSFAVLRTVALANLCQLCCGWNSFFTCPTTIGGVSSTAV